jgi:sugar lactone lactonase YvrE
LLVDGLHYGEGPRWHDGALWISDVKGKRVLEIGEDGTVRTALETADEPSGLGWFPDGRLVFSTLGRASVQVVTDGIVSELHDLSAYGWSTNDMLVDDRGRIYVDVYREFDEVTGMPIGDVLFIDDAGVRFVARDLLTPNGMALTADGGTLVLSETFGASIYAFPVADDGTLGERRTFADLGPDRRPDGLCLDADGAVWVGSFETREFLRVLDGGEITHRIETPDFAAVATALGGADGKTLFLALDDMRALGMEPPAEPQCRVHVARVDVPGIGY